MNGRPKDSLRLFLSLAFFLSTCAAGLPGAPTSIAAAQSQTLYQVVIESGVRVKMRDGVSLVADVFRPRGEGKFPVLLERTPYDRKGEAGMAYELSSRGYVVVL